MRSSVSSYAPAASLHTRRKTGSICVCICFISYLITLLQVLRGGVVWLTSCIALGEAQGWDFRSDLRKILKVGGKIWRTLWVRIVVRNCHVLLFEPTKCAIFFLPLLISCAGPSGNPILEPLLTLYRR